MIIQPFVFNWVGKHESTLEITSQLQNLFDSVTVVNSDDNYCHKDWLNIGDKFYFSGQFNTALKHFSGDVLFHIQGDVSYSRWKSLIQHATFYMKYYKCGIYAPNLTATRWPTKRVKIADPNSLVPQKNLDIVSCPDETVWFIHKDIINKLHELEIKFSDNDFGWGIDVTFAAISFLMKRLVLRDSNHLINHPRGTNYNMEIAQQQLEKFRVSIPNEINSIIDLIESNKKHAEIYKYLI